MKKIFLIAIVILALSLPVFVLAQGLKDAGNILVKVANPNQTGLSGDLGTSVATVIKAVLALVGTVFLILTIYAGILWMTAQGNEEQVTKAVGIIKTSIIGLIVIMSAYAITYFVTSKLGGVAGTSNQAGCCYTTDRILCVEEIRSACDTTEPGINWQAGSCPSDCPP
jgi:preprotein translocase subunit SecG